MQDWVRHVIPIEFREGVLDNPEVKVALIRGEAPALEFFNLVDEIQCLKPLFQRVYFFVYSPGFYQVSLSDIHEGGSVGFSSFVRGVIGIRVSGSRGSSGGMFRNAL